MLLAIATVALTVLAVAAPPASATFHLMSDPRGLPRLGRQSRRRVRRAADVGGRPELRRRTRAAHLRRLPARSTGSDSFTTDVARGADQSTMVLAAPAAEAEFGLPRATPPLTASDQLEPDRRSGLLGRRSTASPGAPSAAPLPSPAGAPASPAGIPDGMALRRTIAPGCATLLESTDDRDNSAADFSAVFPGPRPNSVAPTEHACAGAGGAGGPGQGAGGSAGRGAPATHAEAASRAKRSRDRTPTFRFAADEAGASFECQARRQALQGLPLALHRPSRLGSASTPSRSAPATTPAWSTPPRFLAFTVFKRVLARRRCASGR